MNSQTDIRDFIPGLNGMGKHKYTVCPFCGKSGKGKGLVTYTPKGGSAESAAFCHTCEKGFSSATDAVMHYEGLSFPEAVRLVSEKTNFLIEEEKKPERKRKTVKAEEKPVTPKRTRTKSF